jgi:hypothetical protein
VPSKLSATAASPTSAIGDGTVAAAGVGVGEGVGVGVETVVVAPDVFESVGAALLTPHAVVSAIKASAEI